MQQNALIRNDLTTTHKCVVEHVTTCTHIKEKGSERTAEVSVQNWAGHPLKIPRTDVRREVSSSKVSRGDVCHFSASVLDVFFQGSCPHCHAGDRHSVDVVPSLRQSLASACVLALLCRLQHRCTPPLSRSSLSGKGFSIIFNKTFGQLLVHPTDLSMLAREIWIRSESKNVVRFDFLITCLSLSRAEWVFGLPMRVRTGQAIDDLPTLMNIFAGRIESRPDAWQHLDTPANSLDHLLPRTVWIERFMFAKTCWLVHLGEVAKDASNHSILANRIAPWTAWERTPPWLEGLKLTKADQPPASCARAPSDCEW